MDSNTAVHEPRSFNKLSLAGLIEQALIQGEAYLSENGALCSATGDEDNKDFARYIVEESSCSDLIFWNQHNKAISQTAFDQLWLKLEDELIHKDHFINNFEVGAHKDIYTPFECTSDSAFLMCFLVQHFFTPDEANIKGKKPWQMLLSPAFVNADETELNNEDGVVAIHFAQRKLIVTGIRSTRRLKNALYAIQSFLLPEKDLLPLKASVVQLQNQAQLMVFAPKKSGKTRLMQLLKASTLADGQACWLKAGLAAFSKGRQLSIEHYQNLPLPGFGSLLENVHHNPNSREVDDIKEEIAHSPSALITTHNRCQSPGKKPLHADACLYLCHDAHQALPMFSLVEPERLCDFYLSGYSSYVKSDTEKEQVQEHFSPCLQGPYALRKPKAYFKLMQKRLKTFDAPILLINTYSLFQALAKVEGSEFQNLVKDFLENLKSIPHSQLKQAQQSLNEFEHQLRKATQGLIDAVPAKNKAQSHLEKTLDQANQAFLNY